MATTPDLDLGLIGRVEAVNQLSRLYVNYPYVDLPPSVVLMGPPQCGKASVVRAVLAQAEADFLSAFVSCQVRLLGGQRVKSPA